MVTATTSAQAPKAKPILREWSIDKKGEGHLKIRIDKNPGQVKAWLSTRRIVAMIAGSQGGKSSFGPHWLDREIQEKGPGDYLVVAANFPLLDKALLPSFLDLFWDESPYGLRYGDWQPSRKVFEFWKEPGVCGAKGSKKRAVLFPGERTRIIFASATNPEALESMTAKAAWLDEAGQKQFRRQAWEAVLRRVAVNRGRVLITTTPYGSGWLKTDIYDAWKNGDKDIDVIQYSSLDNPAFPLESYEYARRTMPEWKFNMFHRGLFSTPAGLIYDCFDGATQVVEGIKVGDDWPLYAGHDFGTSHMAALFIAQDPKTGYFYVTDEYLEGGKATIEHVRTWQEITKGKKVVKRLGGAHHEEGWRGDFTQAGWRIDEPLENGVEAGIQKVYELFKTHRIFVSRSCPILIDELQTYSRELDDNSKPTDKIDNKEQYHTLDALRYAMSDFRPVGVSTGNYAPIRTLSF
jgi:hypothetical protein